MSVGGGRGWGTRQYLVVHGHLERKAQVIAEALLVGNVQADLPSCRRRVNHDGQALSSHQDDMDWDVLLGFDCLGTDEDSGPLSRRPPTIAPLPGFASLWVPKHQACRGPTQLSAEGTMVTLASDAGC